MWLVAWSNHHGEYHRALHKYTFGAHPAASAAAGYVYTQFCVHYTTALPAVHQLKIQACIVLRRVYIMQCVLFLDFLACSYTLCSVRIHMLYSSTRKHVRHDKAQLFMVAEHYLHIPAQYRIDSLCALWPHLIENI